MNLNINSDKYYSANEVVKMGFLPWKSAMSFNMKIDNPKWKEILKPVIEQHQYYRRIYIKGENIIKLKKMLEEGFDIC